MNNLKDYRNNELRSYVIGNIALILYLSGIFDNVIKMEADIMKVLSTVMESAVFSSIIYIYVFLIDSLIPEAYKQKITFFPCGKLPGYTIFSKMQTKLKDNRFTINDVMQKYEEIYQGMPKGIKERELYENAQWYRIYLRHKEKPKIFIANRDYLLCRDITAITLALVVLYLVFTFILKFFTYSSTVLLILGVELIATDIAMRSKASRLAYNVISEDIYEGS